MEERKLLLSGEVPFTQVRNTVLDDPVLSYKAKGIFSVLMRFATIPNWQFNKKHLISRGSGGIKSFNAGLVELKKYGYLIIEPPEKGTMFWKWILQIPEEKGKTKRLDPLGDIPKKDIAKTASYNNTNSSNTEKESNIKNKEKTCTANGKPLPSPPFEDIIADLNTQLGTRFQNTTTTNKLIASRFKEGYKLDDFKEVHRKKIKQWRYDPKMKEFLRPKTLYCASNFENYLNCVEPEEIKPQKAKIRVYVDKKDYDKALKRGDKNISYNPNHAVQYD